MFSMLPAHDSGHLDSHTALMQGPGTQCTFRPSLHTCAGLLQKKSQDGLQTTMEATLMAQQTPAQREQVRQLQPGAVASWWQPGHPGWAIYPVDSEQFMSTGALENVNVTNEQIVAPLPMGCESLPTSPCYSCSPTLCAKPTALCRAPLQVGLPLMASSLAAMHKVKAAVEGT